MSNFIRKNLMETWMYEFTCSENNLVDRILGIVKKLEWSPNHTNASSKTTEFFEEDLFKWFECCINDVRQDLLFPEFVQLPITICWANKTCKLQNHRLHVHPNSFMSGIFYLTDGHNGGDTVFTPKNPWFKQFEMLTWPDRSGIINVNYTPVKGKLVLFPSYIPHSVTAVKDDNIRYSIAFNTFFSGALDDSDGYKTKLIIEPNKVRDKFK